MSHGNWEDKGGMAASLVLGNTVFLSFSLLPSLAHVFHLWNFLRLHEDSVLPGDMSIFQEGRIRKPGKQKGKKVPL